MQRDELQKKLYSTSKNKLINNISEKNTDEFAIYQYGRNSEFTKKSCDDSIEMIYVYAGSCKQLINGKDILLKEGDFCILDTSVSNATLETTEHDIIITINMLKSYISTSLLSRLSSNGIISSFLINATTQTRQPNHYLIFHCKKNPIFKEHIENIICEYFDQKICNKEIIDSYLVIILGELLRSQKEQSQTKKDEPYLGEILQFIEKNCTHCSLKSTAEQFNLHPNYMSAFIRKKTGKTFKALVQEQRMIKASFLLKHSTLNIDEVADEVGYKNLGFFYKKFQLQFEMTPHDYRNDETKTPSHNNQINNDSNELGKIKINPQVFQLIAHRATSEIEGVSNILENIPQSITGIFNRKKQLSGINVDFNEAKLTIDVYVNIKAGISINEIAEKIQSNIHQMILQMTSIKTNEINVYIISLDFNHASRK